MKKLIWALAVVLVIVLVWGVAVFITGQRLEKNYHALLDELSAQSGGVTLVSKSYQRGFLRSQAVTEVHLNLPFFEADDSTVLLEIVHDLRHDFLPAVATSGGRRQWLPALAIIESRLADGAANRALLQKVPKLADAWSSTVVDFHNGTDNRFDIPAFQIEFGGGAGSFACGGMTGEVVASEDLAQLRGTVGLPKLAFTLDGAGIRLEEANAEFKMEKAFESLYLGTMKSRFSHLVVQLSNAESYDFADIRVESDSRQNGQLVEYGEVVEVKGLTSGQQTLGSGRLDLQIRNINGPALGKFYNDIQVIQKKELPAEEMTAAIQQAGIELLGGLSTEWPQIEVRQLQLTTPQGRLDAHALLSLAGKEKITAENIVTAFTRLQAEADVKVSRELALVFMDSTSADEGEKVGEVVPAGLTGATREKAEVQLTTLIGQNVFVAEGDNLKLSAVFRDGQFTLNGKPFGGM